MPSLTLNHTLRNANRVSQIPAIMSMLIFQNSRRQLLSTLMERFEAARTHRDEHEKEDKPEGEAEQRRIDYLLKAIEAADSECKKLEYWSDIKNLAEEGKAGNATDPSMGWDEKWQGLDVSGAKHPERHTNRHSVDSED